MPTEIVENTRKTSLVEHRARRLNEIRFMLIRPFPKGKKLDMNDPLSHICKYLITIY